MRAAARCTGHFHFRRGAELAALAGVTLDALRTAIATARTAGVREAAVVLLTIVVDDATAAALVAAGVTEVALPGGALARAFVGAGRVVSDFFAHVPTTRRTRGDREAIALVVQGSGRATTYDLDVRPS